MFQTFHLKKCVLSLLYTLGSGAFASVLTVQKPMYEAMAKPPLSPPGCVFGAVWTILYILMAMAFYRVWCKPKSAERGTALRLFALQQIMNFIWPFLFFGLGCYGFSAVWLGGLIIAVLWTAVKFRALDQTAFYLLCPYLIWCCFALYLNIGTAVLAG